MIAISFITLFALVGVLSFWALLARSIMISLQRQIDEANQEIDRLKESANDPKVNLDKIRIALNHMHEKNME